ncbi:MAG: 50S ribosomal protein L23 [Candidatus Marinamargulisbacteria bacterium]|jgi:large subunit ribosomal protein L23
MIKRLLVTEKTAALNESNCYVFLIDENANKIEFKKYIANKYNVKVKKVNISKKMGKKVRRGRVTGMTQTYKKAYVYTVDRIESLEEAG